MNLAPREQVEVKYVLESAKFSGRFSLDLV